MDYIITKSPDFFLKMGKYLYKDSRNKVREGGWNFLTVEDFPKELLPEVVSFDMETKPRKGFPPDGALVPRMGEIFSIQVGTKKDRFLFDCTEGNYSPSEVMPLLKGKSLLGQNLVFDLGFLFSIGVYPEDIHDTMLMSQLIYNGQVESYTKKGKATLFDSGDKKMTNSFLRQDLASIYRRELGVWLDKGEQKHINKVLLSTREAIMYCFEDVRTDFFKLARKLYTKILENGQRKAYDMLRDSLKAQAYMEICGIPIDEGMLEKKIEEDKKVLKERELELIEYIYDNCPTFRKPQLDMFDTSKKLKVKLSSTKQMIPVFEFLEIPIIGDKGKKSLKESVIKPYPHPFVGIWLKYQGAKKDVSTYGENLKEMIFEGRIYSSYKTMVDTGRYANRGNKGRDIKLNAPTLTFPNTERARSMFKAPKGRKMIVCDYDGQENTVGADQHGCPTMISSILNGSCLHCAFARLIYPELKDCTDAEIKSTYKKKRTFAKSPRFTFAYGGSGYTIAPLVGGIEEGMRLEHLFKEELHKDIYVWGAENLKEALKTGFIVSVDGFRLKLPKFDLYQKYQRQIKKISSEEWGMYKQGKQENLKVREANGDDSVVKDWDSYQTYLKLSPIVGGASRLRGVYLRTCLNNPIQSRSAFQTKRAMGLLWKGIVEKGWIGKVLICVAPHDEIVLECPEELAEEVAALLEKSMMDGGNEYLTGDLLRMRCTADIEEDWYGAKKTN